MVKAITIFLFIFIISFSVINLYLYFNQGEISYSNLSGRAIKDIPKLPLNMSISIIAFVAQWIILLLIVIFAYFRYMHKKRDEKIHLNIQEIKSKKSKTETDLDVLYRTLKNKKRLSIDSISKGFKIDREKAIGWAKILENSGLVTLEYPALGEPEVRINEKEGEIEKTNPKDEEKAEKGAGKEERRKKNLKKRKR